jgi:hypothetical protein
MADFAGYTPPAPLEFVPIEDEPQKDLFGNPFNCFGNMIDLVDLRPRDWIIKRFLERGSVTTLVSPGGVGKSQLALTLAIYLAVGYASFFGFPNVYADKPQYSVIFNAEDSKQEMSMRMHALCISMGIDPDCAKPYIALISGKDLKLKLLTKDSNGRAHVPDEAKRLINLLVNTCVHYGAVFVNLDPLNKIHEVSENDNVEMGRLLENLTGIADLARVGLLLSHHMGKPSFAAGVLYAGNAASSRGAGEIVNGARAAYTLSTATTEDANRFGLTEDRQIRLVRLDDAKLNRALSTMDAAAWMERESVTLPNGEVVGAFKPANPRTDAEIYRRQLGEALAVEMTGRGTGKIGLSDAVQFLISHDNLFQQMPLDLIKKRLERALDGGIILPNGARIASGLDGGKHIITYG